LFSNDLPPKGFCSMKRYFFAMACLLVCPASHADFADGLRAYMRGRLEVAVSEFRESAEKGDAASQSMLGYLYEDGIEIKSGSSIKADLGESVKWYTRAAERDYAKAQTRLGVLYAIGKGVPFDPMEANRWFEKAIANGETIGSVRYEAADNVKMPAGQQAILAYTRALYATIPKYLRYPRQAASRNQSGKVDIEIDLIAMTAKVRNSSGATELDNVAENAVYRTLQEVPPPETVRRLYAAETGGATNKLIMFPIIFKPND
jgi:TPR repeat protein